MQRKKIVFLMNSKIFSGAESVALTIYDQLQDQYDFTYVTQAGPIVDVLQEREVPYYILPSMSKKEIENMLHILQPDVVHAFDFRASLMMGLVHTKVSILSHLHHNPPWITKPWHPFAIGYRWAAKKCKSIAIVSDAIQKEFVYAHAVKDKMVNIGNPISRAPILEKVASIATLEKTYDVCFVGRLEPEKNPLQFVDIVYELYQKGHTDIQAVMVGEGSLREKVEHAIVQYHLQDTITLVGFQKNPYTYAQSSKILCVPSIWEGFGLVAFEAMTLGLPCVVSKVGGLVDIVEDSCGALCASTEEFVKGIGNLLDNQETYAHMSENALKRAKQLENITEYTQTLNKIYEEI